MEMVRHDLRLTAVHRMQRRLRHAIPFLDGVYWCWIFKSFGRDQEVNVAVVPGLPKNCIDGGGGLKGAADRIDGRMIPDPTCSNGRDRQGFEWL